jgi:hypothetical protein
MSAADPSIDFSQIIFTVYRTVPLSNCFEHGFALTIASGLHFDRGVAGRMYQISLSEEIPYAGNESQRVHWLC